VQAEVCGQLVILVCGWRFLGYGVRRSGAGAAFAGTYNRSGWMEYGPHSCPTREAATMPQLGTVNVWAQCWSVRI